MKILVVDDEFASRMKMEKIMSAFGFCVAAEDGKSAMNAFQKALYQKEYFDLILLDIYMPEMDGIETLYKIRDLEKKKRIPKEKQAIILMVTSHSDKDSVVTSIQAGCDDYIIKPINRKKVLEKFKKFFASFNLRLKRLR